MAASRLFTFPAAFEVLRLNRVTKVLLVILLVVLTAAGTFWGTATWMRQRYETQMDTDPVQAKLDEIGALLEYYFIDDYEPEAVITAAADGAAAGMVEGTGDRWSYYISAKDMQSHNEQLYNSYVGIGVTIQEADDGMEIMSVTAGSPAEEAGIQAGDICVAVEGQKTKELGLQGTKDVVRGEEGTMVDMEFLRGGEPYQCSVERRAILTPVAELEMLEGKVAWISIYNFDYHCAEQTLACIDEALSQGAEALLFDVRFNPGGLKDELVEVLDVLLPEGDIFRSVDYAGTEEVDRSDADCLDLPMVVLVNEDSYSAAEFFAAALQEYGLAEIVGVQTSGKGNFQYTFELSDGSAVALSVGKYFTPNGRSLTDVGVTPDVEMDLDGADYQALYYGTLAPEDDEQLQAGLQMLLEKIA